MPWITYRKGAARALNTLFTGIQKRGLMAPFLWRVWYDDQVQLRFYTPNEEVLMKDGTTTGGLWGVIKTVRGGTKV